jgi:hypothetical protein
MARSNEHQDHKNRRVAYNNCRECRADCERQYVGDFAPWRYDHVHDYLTFVQPRLAAIQAGNDSVSARQWLREFRKALDRRINLKVGEPRWRKLSDSYLERLGNMRHVKDSAYLRNFARVGASALA